MQRCALLQGQKLAEFCNSQAFRQSHQVLHPGRNPEAQSQQGSLADPAPQVYDLTKFLKEHPGGEKFLRKQARVSATETLRT